MLPERRMFEDDACPVADQLLGEMYRANPHGLDALIDTVAPGVRGMLAMYCYKRAHLASIALAIAATCDEEDLTRHGGNAGAVLFAKSRERDAGPRVPAQPTGRRRITLASGTLRSMAPLDDEEIEEDSVAGVAAG